MERLEAIKVKYVYLLYSIWTVSNDVLLCLRNTVNYRELTKRFRKHISIFLDCLFKTKDPDVLSDTDEVHKSKVKGTKVAPPGGRDRKQSPDSWEAMWSKKKQHLGWLQKSYRWKTPSHKLQAVNDLTQKRNNPATLTILLCGATNETWNHSGQWMSSSVSGRGRMVQSQAAWLNEH